MEPAEHWRQVYEAKQPHEVSWFQPLPTPSLEALDRIAADPSQSFIDIGGGASTLVDALLGRGWRDLTVLDIAEPALATGRQRLGQRAADFHWVAADIVSWAPDRAFDVWHDRAVFHFLIGEADRTAYRRALRRGTRPGSHVIIATFAPNGPEKCSGLPVRRYDAAGLAAELGPDFLAVADWPQVHVTPRGSEQRFQWAIFRRA